MATKKEVNNFYNQKHLKSISRKGYYEEKLKFYQDFLSSESNLKILDVACNDGELSVFLTKYGSVLGVDINASAVQECKKKGLNCLLGEVCDLPKKYNNYFDVVVAGDIIEHIFDTDKFLSDIRKVLKKKGVLLLATPNVASLGRRIMLAFGINPFLEYSTIYPSKDYNVGHVRYYTIKDIESQLEMNGYTNIQSCGDKINISKNFSIPRIIAKHIPTFSRNLNIYAQKK
ncbi:methyltransferase domain-containing protein [Candidatus Microgenomates bacterium]|nr:MAG: methyltransferase domain-containing protein [Candidatus Microgenomates bacterium]